MQPQPKNINVATAREKMLEGVELIHAAVSSTLGPRSANVAIKRPFGAPAVIHDGVNVARACLPLQDEEAGTGAEIVFGAAQDTNNGAGDGTTTATILCREIAVNAHRLITANSRPMAVRQGIETATAAVIAQLDAAKQPIDAKDSEKIHMIATISAQVPDIGQMVADAYSELGGDAILTVEESRTTDSSLELKKGMEFDRGSLSPYFAQPGSKHNEAVLENAYVLVTDMHLRSVEQLAPMLRNVFAEELKSKHPFQIAVIASQVEGEALAMLVKNHLEKRLQAIAISAPEFGEKRIDVLKDIAVITGATFITEATGYGLESVTKADLGRAARIVSTKDTTIILEGGGSQEAVDARVAELKEKVTDSDLSAFDSEKLRERLARLDSGIGVLTIGAHSESELKERKERAIDAIAAAKAALSEGIIPGGGTALITAAAAAEKDMAQEMEAAEFDVRAGMQIVFDACRAPFKKLLSNSGYDAGEYWAKLQDAPIGSGVDVMDGEIVNMIEAGIIDPVRVVKTALGHASSAAVAIFTSNTLITELPAEQKEQ